jgi:hypothetical protein
MHMSVAKPIVAVAIAVISTTTIKSVAYHHF